MEKISKKNHIHLNKKNILKYLACATIGGSIGLTVVKTGLHIDRDTHLLDFYYLNTKNIELSNEDLLNEFNKIYNSREDLQLFWKPIYPEISEFILKYGDDLDQEQLLDTLKDLKIEVVKSNSLGNNITAGYRVYKNKILFTEDTFYKSDKAMKEILLHETLHYFFFQGFSKQSFGQGEALDEGTVSLLVREFGDYAGVDDYTKNTYYVRIICELIGSDRYMSACGHHSLSELKKYLSHYATSSEVNKLIKSIDKACDGSNSDNLYTLNTKYDQDAFEIIKTMYQNKNNISIEKSSDSLMKSYCNFLFETKYNFKGIIYPTTENVVIRNYFIKNKDIVIALYDDGNYYGTKVFHRNKNNCK